jgi:hypothetical protein
MRIAKKVIEKGKRIVSQAKEYTSLPLADVDAWDIRPRNAVLRQFEGAYTIPFELDNLPPSAISVYREWQDSGSRLEFTRWCSRNTKLPTEEIALLGPSLKEITLVFSCKFNDIVRLAEYTPHYKSCFTTAYSLQIGRFLADPDIALMFVRDSAGHFKWRRIVRLVRNPISLRYGLIMYRSYGNACEDVINKYVEENFFPVAIPNSKGELLYSPTKHNNKCMYNMIYSDDPARYIAEKGQIAMRASFISEKSKCDFLGS